MLELFYRHAAQSEVQPRAQLTRQQRSGPWPSMAALKASSDASGLGQVAVMLVHAKPQTPNPISNTLNPKP